VRAVAKLSEFIQGEEAVSVSTPRSIITPSGTRLTKKAVFTPVVAYERGQVLDGQGG